MTRKLSLFMLLAASLPVAATDTSDAKTQRTAESARLAIVQRAMNACANAVAARLLPPRQDIAAPILAVDRTAALEAAGHDEMVIALNVADGAQVPLARAECTVTASSRVVNLSVRVLAGERLAKTKTADLQLRLAKR